MHVSEIWRYPVKTMAGERLQRTLVGPLGVEGDRLVHVEDSRGDVITSRTHPRFLGHRGSIGPSGEILVDGRSWEGTEAAEAVVGIAGPGARLVRYEAADEPVLSFV
jgi:uncharacterized protein YcbX